MRRVGYAVGVGEALGDGDALNDGLTDTVGAGDASTPPRGGRSSTTAPAARSVIAMIVSAGR
ncbi:MAG: hypothetical protein H0W07_02770 [Chloroflexi bacterium]|nr:hypothetical protein [Chloroflexota bacterium]